MTVVAFYPVVSTKTELIDIVSRAAWYLSFCQIKKFYIFVQSLQITDTGWPVAEGMDPATLDCIAQIRRKINFILVTREEDFRTYLTNTNIILKWKLEDAHKFVSSEMLKAWENSKKVWNVDPLNTRMEGSFYIEAGLHLLEGKDALIQESKYKFQALVAQLGRFKYSFVLATGPSVQRYGIYDYKNALSIVCNSVIFDDDLMSKVKPQILVFADPIFHFGPSQYAASFRQRLREIARTHDFTIVIPFKYYALFVSKIPELRDRTIAVPFVKDRPFNFDLSENFEVRTTANILTLLLIPLSATFSDEIHILGCDGRPLHENTYFWGHNQKTQINDKMANIREVHPAFFDIDYNDYYLEHCETLEAELRDGEQLGKKFVSLGFSHIPALKSRIGLGPRAFCSGSPLMQTAIIVDPDAKSWAGHYMALNEKLSEQLKQDGLDVEVVCRKDLAASILGDRPDYIPTLTSHSWEVGNREDNSRFIDTFESEINTTIERCLQRCSGQVLLYMYCGSLEHAEVLVRLAQKFPRLNVNVNLFWLSFRLTPEYAKKWKPFIGQIEDGICGNRFIATLPTEELRDHLAELTGCILPLAPHPSTGVSDQTFEQLSLKSGEKERAAVLNVLFPSAPRPEKGYLTSIESVQLLCGEPNRFHPIIRHSPTFSTPKEFAKPLREVKDAEIVEGELTNDEFLQILSRSDIVVLPYTPDAFSKRTSGLLIDSMYFGIPAVVISGTWLGNQTDRFGSGVVVNELSAKEIVAGVKEIAANYDEYRQRAKEASRKYFLDNSWSAFSKFLRAQDGSESKRVGTRALPLPLVGPISREPNAHWDETNCIAEIFSRLMKGRIMIDVGAHHGAALMPFLNKGWDITAFEPDHENRSNLLGRLSNHKYRDRFSLDTRCVSNKSQKGVPFFTSLQSTGISGLSAFHDTHVESQKVDTTTLTEFFQDKPMPAVDFLKIDTEGYDLFVLQGFPWERGKPAVIECEFEEIKTVPLGYTFHDLARYLVERGYTVYVSEWHPIIRYGIRHDWRQLMRYPCELADPKGWGNLLAFRDGIDEELLARTVKAQIKTKPSSSLSKAPQGKLPEPHPVSGTLSIRTVNRLERDGEYQQALKICEKLQQQRSLKMDQLTVERLRRKLAQVS